MNWLEIIGAVGGAAGIVALVNAGLNVYKARGEKTKVDVGNMQEMLEESHKMFNEAIKRYEAAEKRIEENRNQFKGYVDDLRKEVNALKESDRDKERRINNLEKAVNVAWRCKYPEDAADCPVIQEYERRHLCEVCDHKHKEA